MTTTTVTAAQAQQILDEIRKTHATTEMSVELFCGLCDAALFYLRGGFSVVDAARLTSEEFFPVMPCNSVMQQSFDRPSTPDEIAEHVRLSPRTTPANPGNVQHNHSAGSWACPLCE